MGRRLRRTMGSGRRSRAPTERAQLQLPARARAQARAAPREREGRHANCTDLNTKTLSATWIFDLRSAFVATLQAKYVLDLAKADLEYYDKIIDISRERFKAGDVAQIDLDRIELQRVQYESEIETAIVNLRTAKIQLLQLLNDRTPVDQFDVTGPYRLLRRNKATGGLPPGRPRYAPRSAGGDADDSSSRRPTTSWPFPTARPIRRSAPGIRRTRRTITRTASRPWASA